MRFIAFHRGSGAAAGYIKRNRSERRIATAIDLIREAIALRSEPAPGDDPSPHVFVGRSKTVPYLSPAAISHAMRDLREGIGSPDLTAHDLRRSGATRLAIAGVSPFILSKLLNHAGDFGGGSPITMAVYVQHNYMAEKRAAITQLESLILAAVAPQPEPAFQRSGLRHEGKIGASLLQSS